MNTKPLVVCQIYPQDSMWERGSNSVNFNILSAKRRRYCFRKMLGEELEQQLKEVGSKLETPPSNKDALLKLLKVRICE